jgi:iron complex outermembrane receptor protein
MDPPTAYLYPQTFDKVTVIKGPQTVRYGGGNLAGTVLFERHTARFSEPGTRFFGSALMGGYGRNDQVLDVAAGAEPGFIRLIGTRSEADDYKDGDGTKIHSQFQRWSGTAIAGWTPSADTRLEFTLDRSDAEAAYADRGMDGTKFDRTGYTLKLEQRNLSPLMERVEAQVYYQYVDHVMDNFRLRQPPMMNMVMNPDRTTRGARLTMDLDLGGAAILTVGADYQDDEHSGRMASSSPGTLPTLGARMADLSASQAGLFAELDLPTGGSGRWLAGVRIDRAKATVEAPSFGSAPAGSSDRDTNPAGFLRYEHQLNPRWLAFAGLGHAARSPDYWERRARFDTKAERSTQLDLGLGYRDSSTEANLSAYYARIDDYLLIDWAQSGTSWQVAGARNIDATTLGLEADAAWAFTQNWRIIGTLAYVHGQNRSDDQPLAQIPPLEARLALDYDNGVWLAGLLARGVARQSRTSLSSGSIAGRDLGPSAGFGVLSLHAGYRPMPAAKLALGIDNLFDRSYAEHLSRSGSEAVIIGYEQTPRVNEPGRTIWLQASASF